MTPDHPDYQLYGTCNSMSVSAPTTVKAGEPAPVTVHAVCPDQGNGEHGEYAITVFNPLGGIHFAQSWTPGYLNNGRMYVWHIKTDGGAGRYHARVAIHRDDNPAFLEALDAYFTVEP